MKRLNYMGVALILMALAAACSDQTGWQARNINGLLPDLQLGLTAPDGTTVTADDLRGQIALVFFGFTHCPDICPATLVRLRTAVEMLPEAEQQKVTIVFISVDPERDTPERLQAYASAFGDRVLALRTDDRRTLDQLTRRYRVTYGYGEPGPSGQYEVSHSAGVFVFDRQGDARLLIREQDDISAILSDLKRLL